MGRHLKNPPILTDEDWMPTGKYKKGGDDPKKMEDVPAKYLMWLWDNEKAIPQVKQYIQDNLEVIKQQAKQEGYGSREEE